MPFQAFGAWADVAVNQDLWLEFLDLLDQERDQSSDEARHRAVDVALRSAALETGAIEGLYQTSRGVTQTVALQGELWQAKLDEIGADVRGHFEAQLEALEQVLDAVTHERPITEAWIRQLHATTCAGQSTYRVWTDVGWQDHELQRGVYKTMPNNVQTSQGSSHWYAPVEDVAPEMHRLVEILDSDAFGAAHPILQAAFAHYAFVAVHPFADGNGRVSRALASVFLYRAAGVPLVIYSDQQQPYWDALHLADTGDYGVFARFIEDRSLDTLGLVRSRLRQSRVPVQGTLDDIRHAFISHGGLTHAEVNSAGHRILEELSRYFATAGQLLMSTVKDVNITRIGGPSKDCTFWDRPYQVLRDETHLEIHISSDNPIDIKSNLTPFVGVARDIRETFTFIAIDANRSQTRPLRLRIGDVEPSINTAAASMIEDWCTEAWQAALDELNRGIRESLKREGF